MAIAADVNISTQPSLGVRGQTNGPRLSLLPAAAALLLVAFYGSISGKSIDYGYRHDFLNLYTGASLARDGQFDHLYDLSVQRVRQLEILPGNPDFSLFPRPPLQALLYVPLTWMPYDTAFRVFLGLEYAGLAVFIFWAFRRFGSAALVWCACSPVAVFAIAEGQDAVLLLMLALGAFLLLERKRDFASGILLGLMLVKFHLFLLVPVAILVQRRWRMLAGYTAAAALQGIVALAALGGIGKVVAYANFMSTVKNLDENLHPARQISLWGMALNFHFGLAGIAIGAAFVIALVVYAAYYGSDWQWFAAAIAGSMALPPHVWEYDATTLLMPAMFGMFATRNWALRIPAALLVCPLIYLSKVLGPPYTAAASVTLVLFVAGVAACVGRERQATSQRPVFPQPVFPQPAAASVD